MITKKIKANDTEKGIVPFSYSVIPVKPFNDLIERVGEKTTTYKIIPDYNIDNSNNDTLVNAFTYMYKTPRDRINIHDLYYIKPRQVYFDIIFTKKGASFYITTYDEFKELVEGNMKTIWNNSEIRKVDYYSELHNFNRNNTELCEMILKDYNFRSLNVSKDNLYPLTNMMGIIKTLKEEEKVKVNIAIEPMKRFNWVQIAQDEFKAYQRGKLVNNEMSSKEKLSRLGFVGAEMLLNMYIEYRMLIFESLLGVIVADKKEKEIIDIKIDSLETLKEERKYNRLSEYTTRKLSSEAFKIKISILSESNDKNRAKLNMLSVANSYKDLNGDNSLVPVILTQNEQNKLYEDIIYNYINTSKKCILSIHEVSKLITLPQKTLQQEYKIERIDTREIDIPRELQGGKVRIATTDKQGKRITATWSENINIAALAKVFIGPQNAGKTTAVKRTVKDCYKAGYSNIVIDYIENCKTAYEIADAIPDVDKKIIKIGEKDYVPALAFNEISNLIHEGMDIWERIRLSNLLSEQVEYLINAVTDDSTGPLTAPMLRYLHSSCMVTFIKPGATINDVFKVLRRWSTRNEFIRYAKYSECFSKDDDVFYDLEELHERDKDGKIIGTKENLIIGIINRIIILQKNPYIKAMLEAEIDNTENFNEYIKEGKQIFIMIPQNKFPNKMIRDILTTYFVSRIWLCAQIREENKDCRLCNLIFDEVHQVPTTAKFLSENITEFRRHRLGLILSCHFLKQFKTLLTALKSSGASYILLNGTEKENFEMLKEEIKPFSIEEAMNLKLWHSLCVVNYGNMYSKFIGLQPKN